MGNSQINSAIHDWDYRKKLVKQFVSDSTIDKYVFGCNTLGKQISDQIEVTGFVDDLISNKFFHGKPVVRSSEIPSQSIVVSAIVGVLPVTVERHLDALGVAHVDYFIFLMESGLNLGPIPFWGDAHGDMVENSSTYASLLQLMGDEISKQSLQDFINFRTKLDLRYMEKYTDRQSEQYFEDFLNLDRSGLNFFDLGCYDGYTSKKFAHLSPQYNSISAFEPIPRLFEDSSRNLRELRDCTVYNYGASAQQFHTKFRDAGSSSSESNSGDIEVELRRLDDQELPEPHLIKVDIEGSEIVALQGMREAITKSKPMMAVACYHYPSEVLELTKFWASLGLSGKMYFRHYTEGTTETVLFLCPE